MANVSVVLDGNGKLHVVYKEYASNIYYTTNVLGSWSTKQYISNNSIYNKKALDLYRNGDFIYFAIGQSKICIFKLDNGVWSEINRGTQDNPNAYVCNFNTDGSLLYDENGDLYIVTNPFDPIGSWDKTLIDSTNTIYAGTSVIDKNGKVFIVYNADGGLVLASDNGSGWEKVELDSSYCKYFQVSAAEFDSSNKLHIVYNNGYSSSTYYMNAITVDID